MEQEQLLQAVMGLIIHSGNAKSECMEAIQLAKQGQFDEAEKKLEAASQELTEAHHSQTALLSEEAKGEHVQVTLLLIHAQDHLMTSLTFKDLAKEVIEIHKKLA